MVHSTDHSNHDHIFVSNAEAWGPMNPIGHACYADCFASGRSWLQKWLQSRHRIGRVVNSWLCHVVVGVSESHGYQGAVMSHGGYAVIISLWVCFLTLQLHHHRGDQ